ncbi:hypothetical protein [Yoonia sp. MH D7]
MFKTLIAGIAAASLTLGAVSPAQAGRLNDEQVGKILLGVVATAAVASIISNKRKQDAAPAPTPRPRAEPQRGRTPTHLANRAQTLPRQCLENVNTRHGTVPIFTRDCLRTNYRAVNALPRNCQVRLATRHGARNGFDQYCLRDAGYTASRR